MPCLKKTWNLSDVYQSLYRRPGNRNNHIAGATRDEFPSTADRSCDIYILSDEKNNLPLSKDPGFLFLHDKITNRDQIVSPAFALTSTR